MKTHILVVDDDTQLCNSIQDFLEMSDDYKVSLAFSAEEALRKLKTSDVQVVITDIILPAMNGLELTEQIKKNYEADVIVMTGYSYDYFYEQVIYKGASDFVFKPFRMKELLIRLKKVLRDQELAKESKRMLKQLEDMTITDDLTKLYNSRHFYHQLKTETERAVRYNRPISLLFMDIDSFKYYNDTYGHPEGNNILIKVGNAVRSSVRKTDSVYRYGGDEFTVILPETDAKRSEHAARRIVKAISSVSFSSSAGKKIAVTVSIGITEYSPNEELSLFIRRSDRAMFSSKQKGRNRITSLYAEPSCS
jgi:two-component system, cell cycle response regulator